MSLPLHHDNPYPCHDFAITTITLPHCAHFVPQTVFYRHPWEVALQSQLNAVFTCIQADSRWQTGYHFSGREQEGKIR